VFVGDGKGAAALVPFWRQVRRAHAKIKGPRNEEEVMTVPTS